MTRQCGGCTVCCFVTQVPELGKPTNSPCRHCDGRGCRIYAERPGSCRRYSCLWLQAPEMPDELRPDRCGIMFEKVVGKRTVIATVDPARPKVLQDPAIVGVIDRLVKEDRPVILVSAGHPQPLTILPEGWTPEDAWMGRRAS